MPAPFRPSLTDEQAGVWAKVAAWFDAPTLPAPQYLLHGVTGSGKTEIYLHAIARTLEQGKQAIVLVPEIALTPQTVARFAGRFPNQVAVIHSELSTGERYDTWRRIRDGEVDIVVGPRSALFSPLPRLGLIILDEEHESSYKQAAEEWGSNTVFYDARTLAIRLAELTGSPLILGSATPSLESYHSAIEGSLTLLELPRRVMGHRSGLGDDPPTVLYAEMPPVEIVDMRQELRAGNRSILSRSLQAELVSTFQAGEQAILFLNRRGTSTFVMCRDCGHVVQCDGCDVPLTYHERVNVLVCHHCNKRYPIPDTCPECDSKRIKYFGSGTQRLEELVQEFAPRARILRWDADTTGHKGSHEAIMAKFAAHEADILVGTQMIAKGLDLPMVTLVGAIAADTGLFLPDFRSGERTFQLAHPGGGPGRAQRAGRPGGDPDLPPGPLRHPSRGPARLPRLLRAGDRLPPGASLSAHPPPGQAGLLGQKAGKGPDRLRGHGRRPQAPGRADGSARRDGGHPRPRPRLLRPLPGQLPLANPPARPGPRGGAAGDFDPVWVAGGCGSDVVVVREGWFRIT